jgi:hypothetical protein
MENTKFIYFFFVFSPFRAFVIKGLFTNREDHKYDPLNLFSQIVYRIHDYRIVKQRLFYSQTR